MTSDERVLLFLKENKWVLLCFALCFLIIMISLKYNALVKEFNDIVDDRNFDIELYCGGGRGVSDVISGDLNYFNKTFGDNK